MPLKGTFEAQIQKACRTCLEVFWGPKKVVLCDGCLKKRGRKRGRK